MAVSKPSRYRDATFDKLPGQLQEMFWEMHRTGKGIYLHGNVGVGKTYAAYAMAEKWQELYENNETNHSPFYFNVPKLLTKFREEIQEEYPEDRVQKKMRIPRHMVVLDDLGAERVTDWVKESLYLVINVRYEHETPTIITSNYDLDTVSDSVGDRIASRISEMCQVVSLAGDDRRI